jgi:hypothetical protein
MLPVRCAGTGVPTYRRIVNRHSCRPHQRLSSGSSTYGPKESPTSGGKKISTTLSRHRKTVSGHSSLKGIPLRDLSSEKNKPSFFLPLTRGDVPTVSIGTEGLCDVATTPSASGGHPSSAEEGKKRLARFSSLPFHPHALGQACRLTADAKRHDCNGSNECLLSGGNSRQHVYWLGRASRGSG